MAHLGFYVCVFITFSNAALIAKRHLHHQESPDAFSDLVHTKSSSNDPMILPTDGSKERNHDESQEIHRGHIQRERDTYNYENTEKEQYAEKGSYVLEEGSYEYDEHPQHPRDLDHQEDITEDQETDGDNDEETLTDMADLVLTMKKFTREAVEALNEIDLKEIAFEAVNGTALQPIFEHSISKRALELLPLLPAAAIPLIETIIGLFSGLGVATFMDIIPTPKEMIESMLGVNLDVPEGFHEVLPLPKKKDSHDDYHDHHYGGYDKYDSYAPHGH